MHWYKIGSRDHELKTKTLIAMATMNLISDEQEQSLFLQIKKEMCIENPKEIIQQVAAVLQAFRQTLSLPTANEVLNRLPDFLKMAFVSNWRHNESPVTVHHLDEFVNLVMVRDRRFRKFLFKNEVHTLSIIILTLKKLHSLIDLSQLEGISLSLQQELSEVDTEGVFA